jgi:diguanylate cyclase (GGDEF)-like protein
MRTRVLFFDDEPQTAGVIKAALISQGYTLTTPKTLQEAFTEINSNGAELLIHSATATKTHWDLCNNIFKEYPELPSIHIISSGNSEGYPFPTKGPFHQRVRPLDSIKEFTKKVRRLIFMGRMVRENAALNKTVKLQNRIDKLFETLDYNELKTRSVEFFAKEFKAKNAFFLSMGGFGYYLNEAWKVSTIDSSEAIPNKHKLCSSLPSTEGELSQLIGKISKKLPSGWEFKHSRTVADRICFIPLVGNRSKKVIGHIMLVDAALYGDNALERVMPYLTRVLGRHLEHAINHANTKSLTYIDDLTSLYNQRYLKLVLDKEISRASRTKTAFSVLFMDIDHFKQVNDSRGHVVGSKILVEISKILGQQLRSTDYGFRYGGDEFILILVGSDANQSLGVAERIRKQVEASTFEVDDKKIKLTLSIGIASYPDHATTKEEILELADRAMYCGKSKSRNVVYIAS